MAKFRVMYKSTDYVYLDVEADSLEEAKEIAENTDGGEFIEDGTGDWKYEYTADENGNVIERTAIGVLVKEDYRETFYRPLTQDIRKQINDSIRSNVAELNTCQDSVYVRMQKAGYGALRNIINALPDGYPIPFNER